MRLFFCDFFLLDVVSQMTFNVMGCLSKPVHSLFFSLSSPFLSYGKFFYIKIYEMLLQNTMCLNEIEALHSVDQRWTCIKILENEVVRL